MKLYFIFLNIFLFLVMVALIFLHFRHIPPKPDKVLSMTPTAHKGNYKSHWNIPRKRITNTTVLARQNLFDPRRGKPLPPPPKVKELGENEKKKIELVGICKIGNFSGAIIANKDNKRKVRSKANSKEHKKIKTYFKPGEKLENGYLVKEINFASVVLSSGNDEFVLKLDRKDSGSGSRVLNVPKTRATPRSSVVNRPSPATRKTSSKPIPLTAPPKPEKKRKTRFHRRKR